MASAALFTPAQPQRTREWVPAWRGFFGKRMRNSLHGWPESAFEEFHRLRTVMGIRVHVVTAPAMIQRVLLDNKANYIRPRLAQRILAPLLGNGLLSSEGEDWRKQRRIVAPSFAPSAVDRLTGTIAHAAREQVAVWPADGQRIDVARAATEATMRIIADALFASDRRLISPEAGRHIDNLIAAGGQARVTMMLGIQNFDPSPMMQRARKGRQFLRETLTTLVRERGPGGGADDFFGGLIRALHDQFPAEEAQTLAVDNAITFYVAGHETTANALAWTTYLLAAQPGLQEEARAEAITALEGDVTTLAERVPLLKAILEESLRLYPAAPRFDREAVADDDLEGVAIEKGDLVSLWPWVTHRHKKLWDEPDAFDHRRFLPENRSKLHRFQYFPFGGGPRVCVGARFATVEALIILGHWLAARRFRLPPGFRPDPVGTVTLRPRGGMPLIVDRA